MTETQASGLIESATKEFIDICPHCDTKAHLRMLFNEHYKTKGGALVYHVLFRCVPCKGLVTETFVFKKNPYDDQDYKIGGWEDKFPTEEIIFLSKFKEVVPEDVLEDFREGVVSLKNKCPRAASGMFRRSLQSTMLNLGADPADDLIDQIKNLASLTSDIKDWAHNIRIFGNWGVHPQDDNLKEVNNEVAEEAQSFLEEFFNYVYLMPSKVAKARGISVATSPSSSSTRYEFLIISNGSTAVEPLWLSGKRENRPKAVSRVCYK